MNIIDLIFPKVCVGCGREGQYICTSCQRKLVRPQAICPICCKPSVDGWTHTRCKTRYGIERLQVGLPYPGMVQICLKKVKYKSAWDMIHFLYGLCEFSLTERAVVTYVPMWEKKVHERGFDQAKLLSQLVAATHKSLSQALLARVRETRPMFGLKKEERRKNVEGAFVLAQACTHEQMQSHIILVDDVWTTGATMRECAHVLKRAGVKEVWGVTLAR